MKRAGLLAALALLAAAPLARWLDQRWAAASAHRRLEAVKADLRATACPAFEAASFPRLARAGLASWQSVGGCGVGASTGTGGGVKWIGRNVRGGLFHLECQANYVKTPYGYNFVGTSLVSVDLTPEWNLGVSVPYVYKYMVDPYDVGIDLANRGPGDVSLLVTRRLGDVNDWSATAVVGAPTGAHQGKFRTQMLPQDRQLGLGKPTASLILDHTSDQLWGAVVVGGAANWRGGQNALGSYRAPSASLYGYLSYLLGPFAPAIGVSATGFAGYDRDIGRDQSMPLVSVAGNASLEWATDWMALLIGISLPYDYAVRSPTEPAYNRLGSWTAALGAAFAAF